MDLMSLQDLLIRPKPILSRPQSKSLRLPQLPLSSVVEKCALSSAPIPSSTENPGKMVTYSYSFGGDGSGGNGKFFYGGPAGGGEEEAWEELQSVARLADGTKEEAREDDELLAGFVEEMKKMKEEESGGRLGILNPLFPYRMSADPPIPFMFVSEVMNGSCCAKIGELRKRGKGFLSDLQQHAADLLVGMVYNVHLLDMLASCVRPSHPFASRGNLGGLQHAFAALSSSAFVGEWSVNDFPLKQKIYDHLFKVVMDSASKAAWSACKFSAKQILSNRFYKGVMFGFVCGIVAQGTANLITTAKVPPNLMSAALLGGVFFYSVNQIMGSQKEASPMVPLAAIDEMIPPIPKTKRFPPVSVTLTAGLQFANHAYDAIQYGRSGLHGVRYSNTEALLSIGLSLTTLVD